MTDHAVIKAEYSDYRRVKGRKVIQLVCEVPIEQAATVHERLGEPGAHDKQIWVAIALLKPDAKEAPAKEAPKEKLPRERVPFDKLKPSQQAGILCADPEFWAFLEIDNAANDEAAEAIAARKVRNICGVSTRSDLCSGGSWTALLKQFRAYQTEQRYAGTPALEKQK